MSLSPDHNSGNGSRSTNQRRGVPSVSAPDACSYQLGPLLSIAAAMGAYNRPYGEDPSKARGPWNMGDEWETGPAWESPKPL